MPRTLLTLTALAGVITASPALGGGNLTHLVPASVHCPGPDACVPAQKESRFTFESVILRSGRGKYANPKKPAFIIELKGVRDASGTLVTSEAFTIRVSSGQINLGGGQPVSLPAGFPLAVVAPIPISLRDGVAKKPYSPSQQAPSGTVVEGGGIDIYDSDGKRLATTGAQYR